LRERGVAGVVDGSVVEWDEDGSNVRPGPNASKYESVRKECGAHILPNAFWKIPKFDVQQMLPSDGMHVFDLGALIRHIIAILLKYSSVLRRIWIWKVWLLREWRLYFACTWHAVRALTVKCK
jgi:hypothetical protein